MTWSKLTSLCKVLINIKTLIKRISRLYDINGKKIKKPTDSEIKNGHIKSFRRGVFFKKDMKKGSVIKKDDLITLRPNIGIDSRDFFKIINKTLNKDISKLTELNFNMFNE